MPKKAKTAQPLSPELLQAQKLQAIGALAGGVAHDFNNLLTVIIGHTDMLLHRHLAGDPSFADIVQIKENAQRAAHLTRQLLAFSRKQTLREENFSPETLIENLKPLLSRLLGEKVKLDIRCRKPLWNCFADARQLEQAIINLLVNARDAMAGEGALTLTLYMEKGRIIWEVADSGKGMDAETKEKAFTPFFTTKALGEGTGLGLAMVHGFVLQSGGEIELHSTLGKGTTVRILLPRVKPAQKTGAESRPAQNSSNILLVEDEKDVRTLAAMALSAAGFNVWQADCAEKAIEIYQQQKPDLLISDVVMPGMNGTELAQKLKQKQPSLKIILISGYAEQDIGNVRFLPKPFSLKELTGEAHAQLAVS